MTDASSILSSGSSAGGLNLKPSPALLDFLVCPVTHTTLKYESAGHLVSKAVKLSFPIYHGIPVMIVDEAWPIGSDNRRLPSHM